MSHEGASPLREQAEALVSAVNARDFDAFTQVPLYDPASEFRSVVAVAEGETYVGVEGIRRWAENVDATWEDFRTEIVDFRPASGDCVVVVYHVTGRGRASGVPLDVRTAQVWTLRDGKLVRNEAYGDPREAFRAAGLSE